MFVCFLCVILSCLFGCLVARATNKPIAVIDDGIGVILFVCLIVVVIVVVAVAVHFGSVFLSRW